MSILLLAVTLLAQLGGDYGDATARGEVTGTASIEVELTVEAPADATLVAHLIVPGGSQQTVALAEREPGLYGGFVELPRANVVVVFEAIGEPPSDPVTLLDLGLDPAVLGMLPAAPTTTVPASSPATQWGWLALASGAGALAVLALWVLVGRPAERSGDVEPSASEV